MGNSKDKLDGKKRKTQKQEGLMHNDLKGFDIRINHFGELQSNFDMDKINAFLNENLEDPRLKHEEE